jgi:hypothetical protein
MKSTLMFVIRAALVLAFVAAISTQTVVAGKCTSDTKTYAPGCGQDP